MSDSICVGIALTRAEERAQVTEWLEAAGHRVVSLVDACHVNMEVAERGFGCVLADAELLTSGFLAALRRQDPRLQMVAIVNAGEIRPELQNPCLTTLSRPVEQPAVTLAISLAYGENRHLRRSPRWRAPRLPAWAGTAAAEILDLSVEGLRLELARSQGAKLTPRFRLRVPMLALDIVVRRVWVGGGAGDRVQCGAALIAPHATQQLAWERGLDLVRSSGSIVHVRAADTLVAEPEDSRLVERISRRIALTPLVRSLAGRLLNGRL